jgi:hypothetical protein
MFYNYNEEIKRQKEQTIRSQNVLVSTICSRNRDRNRDRIRDGDRDGNRAGLGAFWLCVPKRHH